MLIYLFNVFCLLCASSDYVNHALPLRRQNVKQAFLFFHVPCFVVRYTNNFLPLIDETLSYCSSFSFFFPCVVVRYVNHSGQPNLVVELRPAAAPSTASDGRGEGSHGDGVALTTLRSVAEGEELTFDYGEG